MELCLAAPGFPPPTRSSTSFRTFMLLVQEAPALHTVCLSGIRAVARLCRRSENMGPGECMHQQTARAFCVAALKNGAYSITSTAHLFSPCLLSVTRASDPPCSFG
jgi:hypothetical protein